MRKSSLILSTVLLASVCAAPAQAGKFLDQGIEEFNKGHFNEALGLFGAAKGTDEDNPVMHYYRATTLVRLNYKADAIREYKMAIDLQPTGRIAEYSTTALRALGALPSGVAPTSAAGVPAKGGAAPVAQPKIDVPNIQQPQVICIVDQLVHSSRVDMIISDLQTAFGDVIIFKRSTINSPDEKTKDLLKRYNIARTPAIILIGDDGSPRMQFSGDEIVEDNVRKQVEELAKTSRWKEPGASQDPHLVEFRHEVLSELQGRIADDQLRVDREIKDTQDAADAQVAELQRTHRMAGYSVDEVSEIKQETERKVQAIRNDFEKRKTDWRTAAEAKIQARKR